MTDLRVTIRALLEDFELDITFLDAPLNELAEEHELLKAFMERRSQDPEGGETTQLPCSSQVVFNLHAGRFRGLTWWDKTDDVVWLLGGKWHESGASDDAYILLKKLDEADRLLPGEDDYAALIRWRRQRDVFSFADIVEAVTNQGQEALAKALADPGTPMETSLAGVLNVTVVVEEVDDGSHIWHHYTVVFHMPPAQAGVLPADNTWQARLAPEFLPRDADISHFGWDHSDTGLIVTYEDLIDEA